MSDYRFNTKCIQSGYTPKNGEPRVVPIVQSTTYLYENAAEMAKLFDLGATGYFYTRLGNPTTAAVERKIADLEGGIAATLTASGQSASMLSVLNIAGSGDHVVASSALYGGTFNLFSKTMREMGLDFTFVTPDVSPEELAAAFRPNTKAVFAESLSNPALEVLDFDKFSTAAHDHGVPLIVDNTFPTPANCRPLEHGADIVVHSTTKYMDGHACAMGGVIVDGGKFNWKNGKFPCFTEPEETYHGLIYCDTFGDAAYTGKLVGHLMRDIGAIISPQNAFLLNLGLETLPLRMERHCSNATKLAEHLSRHEKISWVNYPALEGCKGNDLVKKYMPNGTCGVVSFGVKGGREAAVKFMEGLRLAAIVTHVADARTCVLHPASTTHRQLNEEQLAECGVLPDLIRFSVGIEDINDIIEDVDNALAKL